MSRQSVGFVVQRVATAVAGLSLILQLGSCSRGTGVAEAQSQGGRGGGRGDAAVPVTTARAIEKPVPVEVTTIGTGEALSTVEVRAQVAGPLMSVQFTEGQDVQQGQLLFTIDPRPFEVAVQQAEAAVAKDEAQAKGTENTRARNEDLFKRELLSRSDYDASVTAATGAAAMVLADKAALETREAPAAVHEDPRAGLRPDGRAARPPGQPGPQHRHDAARRHQSDRADSRRLRGARPVSRDGPRRPEPRRRSTRDRAHAGRQHRRRPAWCSFIDNTIDTTTGTIKLKATFPNTDHQLWPGALVEVTLRAVDRCRTRLSCRRPPCRTASRASTCSSSPADRTVAHAAGHRGADERR